MPNFFSEFFFSTFNLKICMYFQFNFAEFQGVIWKIFLHIFQKTSYFLKYVVLRIAKLGRKLSAYRWDTLYINLCWPWNWIRIYVPDKCVVNLFYNIFYYWILGRRLLDLHGNHGHQSGQILQIRLRRWIPNYSRYLII